MGLVLGTSSEIQAQDVMGPLMPRKTYPFVSPGRVFSVNLPPGWQVRLRDDPYTIQFDLPEGDAFMVVRRILVPPGANPRQLRLNALEKRLSRQPAFKVVSKRDVRVAGLPGASVVGTYAFQGNLEYPRALEEIYVVTSREAFIFHFECFQPFGARLGPQVNRFLSSFVPRPVPEKPKPKPKPRRELDIDLEKIPF